MRFSFPWTFTYRAVSRRFKAILKEYTPLVESVGLDEAFMDVTQSPHGFPEQIAREIKRRIKREIGLTAFVGVGPNKLLAKIASDLNKPDGLTVIRDNDAAKILAELPTSKLWGVGKKTEKRLRKLGIETIGQLASALLDDLISAFGEKWGMALHEHARGMDESPVIPFHEPKSMGRELTYQRDTANLDVIKKTLFRLVEETVGEMNRRGYRARTIALKLRTSDFTTTTRADTLQEPTGSLKTIWQKALKMLSGYSMEKKLRLVGIRVSNLEKVR
jgi:DNA polymerase-4